MILARQCSVLIVDRSEETREVLRTALERRGMHILATSRAQRGRELAQQHHPDLIVLDLEVDDSPTTGAVQDWAKNTPRGPTPIVMLGSVRRSAAARAGEFVAKPYHYAPLIRRIEELLGTVRPALGPCV